MTVLSVRGLACRHADRTLFENLDFTVGAGESLAVVGASGSGKTTLLAVLAGLADPAAGEMELDGAPLDRRGRRRLAIVLQGYGLISLLTATENVEAAMRAAGRAPRHALDRAAAELACVGLHGFEDHLVEELSGGQQQRVAVARALAQDPDVLLADEPTAEQDPATRAVVLGRLRSVTERGGILILATHDLEVAEQCSASVRVGRPPAA